MNEWLFPIDIPEEYGIFTEEENKFESSYSGNNPMMYRKSDIEKIEKLINEYKYKLFKKKSKIDNIDTQVTVGKEEENDPI